MSLGERFMIFHWTMLSLFFKDNGSMEAVWSFETHGANHPTTQCHLLQLQTLSAIVYCSACCHINSFENAQNSNVLTSFVPQLCNLYLCFYIQEFLIHVILSLSALLVYVFRHVSFGHAEWNVGARSKERVCFTCQKILLYSWLQIWAISRNMLVIQQYYQALGTKRYWMYIISPCHSPPHHVIPLKKPYSISVRQ